MDLSIQLGSLRLKNPVIAASGTFGYGEELNEYFPVEKLGAVSTKGLSLKPREGNPMPRIVETPSGMINAIGLQNVGIAAFLRDKLPFLEKRGVTVIANIFGNTLDEYVEIARQLQASSVQAVELNISCPNVKAGGMEFGNNPKMAAAVTEAVRKVFDRHLMVKLSPNVTSIAEVAKHVEVAGADSLSLINTITAMVINTKTRRPMIANGVGGLSGPAIRPIAVRMVAEVYSAVKIPIVGIGGIVSCNDALEFFIAGASAVQVGTATFMAPDACSRLLEELQSYFVENRIGGMGEVVGSLAYFSSNVKRNLPI
ncbi:MAG TPA: dihydroorotate dehydrogenase [Deltaproteobacteria bacterium]|nr:dihydroorotate dehydrogenase [Deltaproteobacteria bacterium]